MSEYSDLEFLEEMSCWQKALFDVCSFVLIGRWRLVPPFLHETDISNNSTKIK